MDKRSGMSRFTHKDAAANNSGQRRKTSRGPSIPPSTVPTSTGWGGCQGGHPINQPRTDKALLAPNGSDFRKDKDQVESEPESVPTGLSAAPGLALVGSALASFGSHAALHCH